MANDENLIPMNRRTKSEQRKIATAGGKASGAARRKKRDMRKAAEMLLNMPVSNKQSTMKATLTALGIDEEDMDYSMGVMAAMLVQAANGNVNAAKFLRDNVTYNNAAYSVLGNAQELETANTFKVALTMSQVVVEDDAFIQELVEAMESQTMPVWDFQGVLKGRNGTEERMVYRECIPSGQVDLQNITVGDVIKRAWNFAVNRPPKLQNLLALG